MAAAGYNSWNEQLVTCFTCFRQLVYPPGAAVIICPSCNTLWCMREPSSLSMTGQMRCSGCHQYMLFNLGMPVVSCSQCRSRSSTPPPNMYTCRCGLYLTYASTISTLMCSVCHCIQTPTVAATSFLAPLQLNPAPLLPLPQPHYPQQTGSHHPRQQERHSLVHTPYVAPQVYASSATAAQATGTSQAFHSVQGSPRRSRPCSTPANLPFSLAEHPGRNLPAVAHPNGSNGRRPSEGRSSMSTASHRTQSEGTAEDISARVSAMSIRSTQFRSSHADQSIPQRQAHAPTEQSDSSTSQHLSDRQVRRVEQSHSDNSGKEGHNSYTKSAHLHQGSFHTEEHQRDEHCRSAPRSSGQRAEKETVLTHEVASGLELEISADEAATARDDSPHRAVRSQEADHEHEHSHTASLGESASSSRESAGNTAAADPNSKDSDLTSVEIGPEEKNFG